MPTIVFFEIPADDIERAKAFYKNLFGWDIKKAEGMDYWLINTTGENPIMGGMMKRMDERQPITNYIDVDSIEDYSAKVDKLGGRVLVPKSPVKGYGYFSICMDSEKNIFALWKTDMEAR